MRTTLVASALLACLAIPAQAAPVNGFAEFRSYPYLDRGYRAASRADWREVERLMRHLLQQVPEQVEARGLLIQALARQGRFAEATELAEALGNTLEGARALLELRLARIARELPEPALIGQWLADSDADARQRLWQGYSLALAKRRGDAAALRWLQTLPEADDALRRWRATWAEKRADWPAVIADLAPLQARRVLAEGDWLRLAHAHAQRLDETALRRLLAQAPSPRAAQRVRLMAAERAIAARRSELAKAWLQELGQLDEVQQRQLWELGRQSDDIALVRRLSASLDRPCLETAEWLSRRHAEAGHTQFRQCTPEDDPEQWLVLAQRFADEQALAKTRLPQPWEPRQQALLVQLWVDDGRAEQALTWLAGQRQTPAVLKQRAELLQRGGDATTAASIWERLYRESGDALALDQASFLWLRSGERQRALSLLQRADVQRGGRLSETSLQRLAGLYADPQTPLAAARIEPLLNRVDADARAQLLGRLAEAGVCEPVRRNAGEQPREVGQLRALGRCAMPQRPGEAVVYYRQALEQGDESSRLSLAYALDAAGDAVAAHQIWRTYPDARLDRPARLAAARSALGADEPQAAEQRWQASGLQSGDAWRLGAAIAAAARQPELALQRQQRALQVEPRAEHYYSGANIAEQAGDPALSLAWLREATRLAPQVPRYRVDYALRLAASRDPAQRRESIALLRQATRDYPQDYRLPETLAARLDEMGDSAGARTQLRAAIDLQQVPLQVAEDSASDLEQRRYRLRRAHESLERRNSFSIASTWSPAGVAASGAQTGGARSSAENIQIATWDHRLGEEPSEAGRSLSVYGRLIQGGSERSRYGETLGAGVGLRYKPFGQLNLNLYGELYGESRLPESHSTLSLGQALTPGRLADNLGDHLREGRGDVDLLLRASASLLDQGKWRNDWRTDEQQWNERQLYLDAAWWTKRGEHQLLARYQQGRAYKLPTDSPQTLMPYAMLQAGAQEADIDWREDLRAGVGLRWQLWMDADRYNAHRARLSLRMEYQQALGGTLYDGEGGWLTGLELNF